MKTSRPKVDYSKWLGPDWKPTYEGASMIIGNHSSWYDVFHTWLFVRPLPGFIAKNSIKEVPAIGLIATAAGSYFMSRNAKDSRKKAFEMILHAQE